LDALLQCGWDGGSRANALAADARSALDLALLLHWASPAAADAESDRMPVVTPLAYFVGATQPQVGGQTDALRPQLLRRICPSSLSLDVAVDSAADALVRAARFAVRNQGLLAAVATASDAEGPALTAAVFDGLIAACIPLVSSKVTVAFSALPLSIAVPLLRRLLCHSDAPLRRLSFDACCRLLRSGRLPASALADSVGQAAGAAHRMDAMAPAVEAAALAFLDRDSACRDAGQSFARCLISVLSECMPLDSTGDDTRGMDGYDTGIVPSADAACSTGGSGYCAADNSNVQSELELSGISVWADAEDAEAPEDTTLNQAWSGQNAVSPRRELRSDHVLNVTFVAGECSVASESPVGKLRPVYTASFSRALQVLQASIDALLLDDLAGADESKDACADLEDISLLLNSTLAHAGVQDVSMGTARSEANAAGADGGPFDAVLAAVRTMFGSSPDAAASAWRSLHRFACNASSPDPTSAESAVALHSSAIEGALRLRTLRGRFCTSGSALSAAVVFDEASAATGQTGIQPRTCRSESVDWALVSSLTDAVENSVFEPKIRGHALRELSLSLARADAEAVASEPAMTHSLRAYTVVRDLFVHSTTSLVHGDDVEGSIVLASHSLRVLRALPRLPCLRRRLYSDPRILVSACLLLGHPDLAKADVALCVALLARLAFGPLALGISEMDSEKIQIALHQPTNFAYTSTSLVVPLATWLAFPLLRLDVIVDSSGPVPLLPGFMLVDNHISSTADVLHTDAVLPISALCLSARPLCAIPDEVITVMDYRCCKGPELTPTVSSGSVQQLLRLVVSLVAVPTGPTRQRACLLRCMMQVVGQSASWENAFAWSQLSDADRTELLDGLSRTLVSFAGDVAMELGVAAVCAEALRFHVPSHAIFGPLSRILTQLSDRAAVAAPTTLGLLRSSLILLHRALVDFRSMPETRPLLGGVLAQLMDVLYGRYLLASDACLNELSLSGFSLLRAFLDESVIDATHRADSAWASQVMSDLRRWASLSPSPHRLSPCVAMVVDSILAWVAARTGDIPDVSFAHVERRALDYPSDVQSSRSEVTAALLVWGSRSNAASSPLKRVATGVLCARFGLKDASPASCDAITSTTMSVAAQALLSQQSIFEDTTCSSLILRMALATINPCEPNLEATWKTAACVIKRACRDNAPALRSMLHDDTGMSGMLQLFWDRCIAAFSVQNAAPVLVVALTDVIVSFGALGPLPSIDAEAVVALLEGGMRLSSNPEPDVCLAGKGLVLQLLQTYTIPLLSPLSGPCSTLLQASIESILRVAKQNATPSAIQSRSILIEVSLCRELLTAAQKSGISIAVSAVRMVSACGVAWRLGDASLRHAVLSLIPVLASIDISGQSHWISSLLELPISRFIEDSRALLARSPPQRDLYTQPVLHPLYGHAQITRGSKPTRLTLSAALDVPDSSTNVDRLCSYLICVKETLLSVRNGVVGRNTSVKDGELARNVMQRPGFRQSLLECVNTCAVSLKECLVTPSGRGAREIIPGLLSIATGAFAVFDALVGPACVSKSSVTTARCGSTAAALLMKDALFRETVCAWLLCLLPPIGSSLDTQLGIGIRNEVFGIGRQCVHVLRSITSAGSAASIAPFWTAPSIPRVYISAPGKRTEPVSIVDVLTAIATAVLFTPVQGDSAVEPKGGQEELQQSGQWHRVRADAMLLLSKLRLARAKTAV
jgi:hypothetical protein